MIIVRTSTVVDELVADDGAVVLVSTPAGHHRVVRISLLGQLIRELAVDGITLERLIEELEARLGPSPEGDAALHAARAVAALEADGLVSTVHRA